LFSKDARWRGQLSVRVDGPDELRLEPIRIAIFEAPRRPEVAHHPFALARIHQPASDLEKGVSRGHAEGEVVEAAAPRARPVGVWHVVASHQEHMQEHMKDHMGSKSD